jgi:hypothetical protein
LMVEIRNLIAHFRVQIFREQLPNTKSFDGSRSGKIRGAPGRSGKKSKDSLARQRNMRIMSKLSRIIRLYYGSEGQKKKTRLLMPNTDKSVNQKNRLN